MSLKSHEDGHGIVDAGVGVNDQLLHHDLDLDLRLGLQKYYIHTNFIKFLNEATSLNKDSGQIVNFLFE